MRKLTTFGGYYYTAFNSKQSIPVFSPPSENDIKEAIDKLLKSSGVIALKHPDIDGYPNELTLYAENALFMLLYEDYSEDGDISVLTLKSEDIKTNNNFFNLLGEPFPSYSITKDEKLIKQIFIEFLKTGEPSSLLI